MFAAERRVESVPFSVLRDPQGFVLLTWTPGTRISTELAELAMRVVDDLNEGRPGLLCVVMSQVKISTRKARAVFSRSCSVTRVALIGESITDRLHATSALGVAPSPVPKQFFTSDMAAHEWLLGP